MENQECLKEYEQKKHIHLDEKCNKCENRYKCKFMQWAMDEVLCGDD